MARRLAMNWGVTPIRYDGSGDDLAKLAFAVEQARALNFVRLDDVVVVTSGHQQTTGSTDLIRVITVRDTPLNA